ncbi:MAG: ATP-binding protein [Flavobacteriales bacterium]|nr:ATP-binding protein [Flavobacteriales bacterium]MBL6872786.1 ATP-binding protein [Flavobacteriales bacterium]
MKRVVITGCPGSGKTSLIDELKQKGYPCYEEVSRQLIKRMEISTSFKDFNFEDEVFNHRKKDFLDASKELQFYDRSMIDNLAYLTKNKLTISENMHKDCKQHKYFTKIFILPPWHDIYETDNERVEDYKEAVDIHSYLIEAYTKYDYSLIEVPKTTLEERIDFILNRI